MKRKIQLEQISIKSFVTELKNPKHVKGGVGQGSIPHNCVDFSDIDTSNTSSRSGNNTLENCPTEVVTCHTYQPGCDLP